MHDVLALYSDAPASVRLFLRVRELLSDLEFVERYVPRTGTIVDLGCGHGLFANLMALSAPERNVIGIDLSPEKIEHAQATVQGRRNIEFRCGDMLDRALPECDAVTIVDVLYLLSASGQEKMLRACRKILKPGGMLVWKSQERRPRWKYAWTYAQEMITTSTGITRGKRGSLTFMSREQALAAMSGAGFRPRIIEMKSFRPYSDVLYLGDS
ncbi:MAG: class I SAM-dependent methyltransferase [Thermoleophilia bacterium]|jgi:2-polyprenyl-6-hydroxyphenyl methylase/3-demethylubiquinone-9 3-methyltransferase